MTRPTVLVTGATGGTGSAVVSQLLEQRWPVRALVHHVDARAERLRSLGAEVVAADLFDADQLAGALRGVDRDYYCPPMHPHMLDSAAAFAAAAARDARLESVVLSQWLASANHPSLLTRQHHLADRLFAALPDLAVTTLNPGFFAQDSFAGLALIVDVRRQRTTGPLNCGGALSASVGACC